MYKNIVFDMGNVLLMYYPEKTLRKYLTDEDDIKLLMKTYYESGYCRDTDRGTKSHRELIDALRGKIPDRLTDVLYKIYVEQTYGKTEMPAFPEMCELVKEIKKNGYKTYLLSNAGYDFYDYSRFIPAIKLMDGKVISCEYKVLKPEPEIYHILFDRYGLNPDECLFIDDTQANVDGGKNVGMDGICFSPSFESVSVLRKKLKEKGINIHV